MNVTKKIISKKISDELGITYEKSHSVLQKFISLIKSNSESKTIKISEFGTFDIKSSPKRYGRNPKTMKSYLINEQKKLNFKSSKKVKELLN